MSSLLLASFKDLLIEDLPKALPLSSYSLAFYSDFFTCSPLINYNIHICTYVQDVGKLPQHSDLLHWSRN